MNYNGNVLLLNVHDNGVWCCTMMFFGVAVWRCMSMEYVVLAHDADVCYAWSWLMMEGAMTYIDDVWWR